MPAATASARRSARASAASSRSRRTTSTLSTTLIGESEILKIDQDGRVVLSDAIKDHAGIADRVTFVGQGYKFQIWEPDRFVAYREEAKNRLRDIRKRLAPGHRAAGVTARTGE